MTARDINGFFYFKKGEIKMVMKGQAVESLNDIQNDLYHIHSLGYLLVGRYQEMVDAKQIIENLDEPSSPLLSIAEIIMEKTKSCIDKADVIDNKLSEREKLGGNQRC
jgi:hypothetical protein